MIYKKAYNAGEVLHDIVLSNDELQLVISFGKKSRSLYCWKFRTSLHERDNAFTEEEVRY
jgi:hypothetical protein